jgi:hypothetical protein
MTIPVLLISRKRFYRTYLTVGALFCIFCLVPAFCGIGILFVMGGYTEIQIHSAFRLYPGATLLTEARAYPCCDSILKKYYYWSPEPIRQIQSYYEAFTLPFIEGVTMYHPSGRELELGFIPYPTTPADEVDLTTDRHCHFSQRGTCIQIELIEFHLNQPVQLPTVEYHYVTPDPTTISTKYGGTLIIYSYHVDADLNFFP